MTSRSGLDYMRAIRDGEHAPAPIQETLDLQLTEVDEGRTAFTAMRGPGLLDPLGTVVRPIAPDSGQIRADGRVVHRGSRTATAEGRVLCAADGKLLAHGTSTCIILGAA